MRGQYDQVKGLEHRHLNPVLYQTPIYSLIFLPVKLIHPDPSLVPLEDGRRKQVEEGHKDLR